DVRISRAVVYPSPTGSNRASGGRQGRLLCPARGSRRPGGRRPAAALRLAVRIVGAALEVAVAALAHDLRLAAAGTGVVLEKGARIRRGHGASPGLQIAAARVTGAADELAEAARPVKQGFAAFRQVRPSTTSCGWT